MAKLNVAKEHNDHSFSLCLLGIIDQIVLASPLGKVETPNAKKRHRRAQTTNLTGATTSSGTPKSSSNTNGGDDDVDENIFTIVSLDKQWSFEAQSNEERDEWVQAIEQQILCSLQNIESSKAARAAKVGGPSMADFHSIQTIKQVPGNAFCADCEQSSTENNVLIYFGRQLSASFVF